MWALVRFVHVLSAMAWVGGQLLLSLLVLPVLRRRLDPASRAPLAREVGVRFGVFTVAVFLPLQLLSGVALAAHRGRTVQRLAEPGYGRTLGAKVLLFAVVLVVSGVHGAGVVRPSWSVPRRLRLGAVGAPGGRSRTAPAGRGRRQQRPDPETGRDVPGEGASAGEGQRAG